MVQLSIHCKILTIWEALMLVVILIGILMLAKTLNLALILTGILILVRILSKIPTLDTTLAGIAALAGTATSEEIKSRTEQKANLGQTIEAGTFPRTLTLAATLRSEEIEISDTN